MKMTGEEIKDASDVFLKMATRQIYSPLRNQEKNDDSCGDVGISCTKFFFTHAKVWQPS